METLTDFKALIEKFEKMPEKKRVVVVCPTDEPTLAVVERCIKDNLCHLELVFTPEGKAEAERLKGIAPDRVNIHFGDDPLSASKVGVKLIHDGHGDVLMKGLVNTDVLLKAVLDKEIGLLPKGNVMSHLAIACIPTYHKLLMFSDAAVIPEPTLEQFVSIIRNDVKVLRTLGVETPKVALIHFTEKVNEKFPTTLAYVALKEMAANGEFGDIKIGGPMDAKTACDLHSSQIKGIASEVAGDADLVILPNLEAGNVFYKSLSLFGRADMVGMLTGTKVPVVIPSRADSDMSKFCSLAVACLSA